MEIFPRSIKVHDKNEDKTNGIKSVCNPKEAPCKWTSTRKFNTKWQAGHLWLRDSEKAYGLWIIAETSFGRDCILIVTCPSGECCQNLVSNIENAKCTAHCKRPFYITTSCRFKCIIQKWAKPLAFLPWRLSLFLSVIFSLLMKVMLWSYYSHLFYLIWKEVGHFQEDF